MKMRNLIIKLLMLISLLFLTGSFIECDTAHGYLEAGIKGLRFYEYDDPYYYEEVYVEEYFCDPYWDWCY